MGVTGVSANMDRDPDFEKLDQLIISSNNSGRPVLRIGLQLQLYLRGGDRRETRARAVEVLADFAKAASGSVSHWQKHMASRMTLLKGGDLAALLQAEVAKVDPATNVYGPHVSDGLVPPRWQGAALLQPADAAPVDLSVLHLAMPAMLAKQDPDDLIRRLLPWCAHAGPLHGTAGLAPIYEIGMQQSYPDETWPLLSRFTGLDYMNAFPLAARGVDQIQAVNWLTVLGEPMLAQIGGAGELQRRLGEAADAFAGLGPDVMPSVHPYDGGVLVRAGRLPQLGDRNIGGVPESYRIVHAALRPWIFTAYENRPTRLLRVPRPLDPYAETIRWITRFDEE